VTNKPFTLPSLFCGFKVRVRPVVSKEFSKILKAADGSMTMLITGSLKVSFTNLTNGKAITKNVSGSGKVTQNPDSLIARGMGHSGNFLTPADAKRFGLPTVSVTTGKITTSIALPSGAITSLSLHGHVLVDVCAALS